MVGQIKGYGKNSIKQNSLYFLCIECIKENKQAFGDSQHTKLG